MLALTLGMAEPSGSIELGEIREFGDWVSGCDNALSCEAVALSSHSKNAGSASLLLFRERGNGKDISGAPLKIKFDGLPGSSDRYHVFVDDRLVDTGGVDSESGEITVTSKDAIRLADAIARGRQMKITDGGDTEMARFSLKGSAASLRHIDAQLGLAGTRQAIVATGGRKARLRKSNMPIVMAKRVQSEGHIPEADEIISFADKSPCASQRIGVTEDRAYPLGIKDGKDQALVLISCGNGGFNTAFAPYLASRQDGGNWKFSPADFDFAPRQPSSAAALPMLFNAEWDIDNQSLSSFSKTSGLGDCGDTSSYVWDGARFRLAQARSMPSCRGTLNWITVWRAKVVFDG